VYFNVKHSSFSIFEPSIMDRERWIGSFYG